VKAHQGHYPIATMCRLLGVSTSGYYAWRDRSPSARQQADAALTERIHQIHWDSKGSYGAPMIHQELRAQGVKVGCKRVARLMKAAGLQGVTRRKWVTTTQREPAARPAPDLLGRDFRAAGPDQRWVADITYIPTWSGFLYLAIVLDVWSRRIVGWAMATHLRSDLVLQALEMAQQQRQAEGVIHHSDQGCQYTSKAFTDRCRLLGVTRSMGSVGDAFDNAMAESFFATLKAELVDRCCFHTPEQARGELFDWIEGWYNTRRRHSSLGYHSPIAYEKVHRAAA
jgi:transposase InsO family protein